MGKDYIPFAFDRRSGRASPRLDSLRGYPYVGGCGSQANRWLANF